MNLDSDRALKLSYDEVFGKTCGAVLFEESMLERSRMLFEHDGNYKSCVPKFLEVNALLGGLGFSESLLHYVARVQEQIDSIIHSEARYWVRPENLGLEYLVTKWPEQERLSESVEQEFLDYLEALNLTRYELEIKGFQINPDGCVVLRGYDGGNIVNTRKILKRRFEWLPTRQSGWAHVPVGRILCNVDSSTYRKLIDVCLQSISAPSRFEPINHLHYVHEKQWYMEKKRFIRTFGLTEYE